MKKLGKMHEPILSPKIILILQQQLPSIKNSSSSFFRAEIINVYSSGKPIKIEIPFASTILQSLLIEWFIALLIHQTHSLVNYILDIEINKAKSLSLKEVLVSSQRESIKIATEEWDKGIWGDGGGVCLSRWLSRWAKASFKKCQNRVLWDDFKSNWEINWSTVLSNT